jgi:NADH-quinone oxidoreductase subunit M
VAPLLAGVFLIAGLSSLALPGTNSFVSEFLVLLGSFPREPVFTVLGTVGIIFAALYVLWVYQQTMQGPLRGHAVLSAVGTPVPGSSAGPSAAPEGGSAARSGSSAGSSTAAALLDPAVEAQRSPRGFPDLSVREIAVVTPLIVLILALGFFPGPVLDVITPSVVATLNEVGLADPVGGLVP